MREDDLYREFGSNLAARRRAVKMTQANVSEKVGMSRASIANIERGNQKVMLHQVYAIAAALGMKDVKELLPVVPALSLRDVKTLGAKISGSDLTEEQRLQIEAIVGAPQVKARARSA